MLILDEFNYCKNIASIDKQKQQTVLNTISDLMIPYQGISFVNDLSMLSEQLPENSYTKSFGEIDDQEVPPLEVYP